MNINEKIMNFIDIFGDLEEISKLLYLESPELWIEFSDKINNKIVDEMVLFYATKYNYVSIIKFVTENKIINLDTPSKNKNFSSIKLHLIAVAKEYNSIEVYNYLVKSKNSTESNGEPKKDINNNSKKESSVYYPVFNCPSCNKNIFKAGYKVLEEVTFNYSTKSNKCEESSRQRDCRVFCGSCNSLIENIDSILLEKMCSINNCKSCGRDLTESGIDQKIKMKLDNKNNTFVSSEKSYVCSSCQEPLSEIQIKHFNL